MTPQIIILNSNTQPDHSFFITGVFWLTANINSIIPIPTFVSVVPFVNIIDLGLLQTGQIIEQEFNSGLFPAGTTLSNVQATLQTQYTTAQTAFGALNPSLANLVGTIFDGTSWNSSSPFTPYSVNVATGTLNALNSTVQVALSSTQSVGVQVAAGTLVGTIVAETSFDDGNTWNQTLFVLAGNTTLFSKSFSISYSTSPNFAQAASIIVNGGSGLVRVRVFAYTSGSCTVSLNSSGIFDETTALFTAGQGFPVPPQIAITGGAVSTTAPSYTNGTSNVVSLNAAGGLRVDGSGVTQPVSGTVAISGTVSNVQSTSPWVDNITQIGGVAVAAVAKGTQASNALGVQDLKDSGRVSFVAAALAATGVTTEALVSLTPVRTVTAGGAATSLTVTAGKTLRITAISVTVRNTSTTQCSVVCRVRMNSTTVTATSQLMFTCGTAALTAVSGSTNNETFNIPDGFEISGTTQFGITQLASATTCTVDVVLVGFEY